MNKTIIAALATLALAGGVIASSASGQYDSGYDTTSTTPTTTAAKPATVKLGHSKLGTYLVNGSSRALYLFAKDTKNKSNCAGACAKAWPPLTTSGAPKAGSGVKKSLLGTITRSDGKTQVTYNGHPLYRYDDDKGAGQHHGQKLKEFGAKWYLVKSSGKGLGQSGY